MSGFPYALSYLYHKKISRNVRKCTFEHALSVKIQISLRIRTVWSAVSLPEFWIASAAKFHHADNEDSDQIALMRRLIWVFVGRTYEKVSFLTVVTQTDSCYKTEW